MAATATETIPTTWNDERDAAFFTITARLFPSEFTYGAGVLLASYDDETDAMATGTPAIAPAATSSAPTAATSSISAR